MTQSKPHATHRIPPAFSLTPAPSPIRRAASRALSPCRSARIVAQASASSIATRDGAKLHVDATHPSSTRPTALFIHDFMTDHRLFDECFHEQTALADHQLVRYDIRGFGASDQPTAPYSRLEDIDDILDALDASSVHIVGCGMGGAIGLEYAIARAARTQSVTCIGGGLPGHRWSSEALFIDITESQRIGRALALDNEYLAAGVSEAASDLVRWKKTFISRAGTWSHALNASDKSVGRKLLLMAKEYRGFHFFQKDPLVPQPCEPDPLLMRLNQVACPVLVLVGEHDTVDFLQIADEIHAGVQNAVGAPVRIAGASHFATLENSDACVEELAKFWGSDFSTNIK